MTDDQHAALLPKNVPTAPAAELYCVPCARPRRFVDRHKGHDEVELIRSVSDVLFTCSVCHRQVDLVCPTCGTPHLVNRGYGPHFG